MCWLLSILGHYLLEYYGNYKLYSFIISKRFEWRKKLDLVISAVLFFHEFALDIMVKVRFSKK